MKSKIGRMLAVMVLVGLAAAPMRSADAWPWGFNCCGMSVGQSWGWGPGGWGGPWGYPYGPWGYPGWWAPPPPPPPLIIVLPATSS